MICSLAQEVRRHATPTKTIPRTLAVGLFIFGEQCIMEQAGRDISGCKWRGFFGVACSSPAPDIVVGKCLGNQARSRFANWVQGSRFTVRGSGFRVQGSRFRVGASSWPRQAIPLDCFVASLLAMTDGPDHSPRMARMPRIQTKALSWLCPQPCNQRNPWST